MSPLGDVAAVRTLAYSLRPRRIAPTTPEPGTSTRPPREPQEHPRERRAAPHPHHHQPQQHEHPGINSPNTPTTDNDRRDALTALLTGRLSR